MAKIEAKPSPSPQLTLAMLAEYRAVERISTAVLIGTLEERAEMGKVSEADGLHIAIIAREKRLSRLLMLDGVSGGSTSHH